MYQQFQRVIENANVIISTYEADDMGESQQVDPVNGTVAFGSALFGWAFSLTKFARIYSQKFKIDIGKMMQKLWGDNYYDAVAKRWKGETDADENKTLKRGFVQFIMEPVIRLCKNCMEGNTEAVDKMLTTLDIHLNHEEKQLVGKAKMKSVFQKWINAADALIEMIILKLPSPVKAQKYRAAYLYEGPIDDVCGQSIKNCDSKGPLMVFISKLVPTPDKSRFYAFGRVFSGTVATGQKVRIKFTKITINY